MLSCVVIGQYVARQHVPAWGKAVAETVPGERPSLPTETFQSGQSTVSIITETLKSSSSIL